MNKTLISAIELILLIVFIAWLAPIVGRQKRAFDKQTIREVVRENKNK